MYNRYVPMEDGTFRKRQIPEPENGEAPEASGFPPPYQETPSDPPPHPAPNIGSFFKDLLPKDLDIEDLIIILLLLLMSNEQENRGNQAMLTLGAYLFL